MEGGPNNDKKWRRRRTRVAAAVHARRQKRAVPLPYVADGTGGRGEEAKEILKEKHYIAHSSPSIHTHTR